MLYNIYAMSTKPAHNDSISGTWICHPVCLVEEIPVDQFLFWRGNIDKLWKLKGSTRFLRKRKPEQTGKTGKKNKLGKLGDRFQYHYCNYVSQKSIIFCSLWFFWGTSTPFFLNTKATVLCSMLHMFFFISVYLSSPMCVAQFKQLNMSMFIPSKHAC